MGPQTSTPKLCGDAFLSPDGWRGALGEGRSQLAPGGGVAAPQAPNAWAPLCIVLLSRPGCPGVTQSGCE